MFTILFKLDKYMIRCCKCVIVVEFDTCCTVNDRPQVFQTMMDQWYLWKILLVAKYGHLFCSHVARYISLEEQTN